MYKTFEWVIPIPNVNTDKILVAKIICQPFDLTIIILLVEFYAEHFALTMYVLWVPFSVQFTVLSSDASRLLSPKKQIY